MITRRVTKAFLALAMAFFICLAGVALSNKLGTKKIATAANQNAGVSSSSLEADMILINYEGYKADRRGPVEFTHLLHARDFNILCWECHHEYNNDKENVWSPWGMTEKCNQCHDPLKQSDTGIKLQKAFHVNCKTCHKNLAKQKKKTGPFKKCYGCHKKGD